MRQRKNPHPWYPSWICQCTRYRPQRSWAKVMFLQAPVILSTGGGGLPQCMLGYHHPPGSRHPPPPRADPSLREQTPRLSRPPREADASIRSMSGRYASYWNAFSFLIQSLLECWVGGEIATGSEFIHMYLLRKGMPKYSITGQTDQWRFCRDNFRMRPHQNFFNFIFWKMFNKMFYPSAKQTAALTFIPSSQLIHKSPLVRKHATACRAR